MDETSLPQPAHRGWRRALGLVGLVLHLVVGYFYLAAGLVVPVPWVVVFWVVWVILFVVGVLLWLRSSWWVLAMPVVALGLLVGGVALGGTLLGWTA